MPQVVSEQVTHGEFMLETDEPRDTAPRVCFTKLHMQKTKQTKVRKPERAPRDARARVSCTESGTGCSVHLGGQQGHAHQNGARWETLGKREVEEESDQQKAWLQRAQRAPPELGDEGATGVHLPKHGT